MQVFGSFIDYYYYTRLMASFPRQPTEGSFIDDDDNNNNTNNAYDDIYDAVIMTHSHS